jgi:sulfur carrier protein ThiS adenylyltransferase
LSDGEGIFRDNPPGLRDRLRGFKAGVAGCGGIGSNVALLLARAGVGELLLVDHDRVEERNLNRQSYFTEHLGMSKVQALAGQIRKTGAGTRLEVAETVIDSRNARELFSGCDVLVEALDLDETKEMLLTAWLTGHPGTPVVACSGLAGLGGPDGVRVDRRGALTVVGDGSSELSEGTLSARVSLVASLMALEAVRILAGERGPCEACSDKCSPEVELTCDGVGIPLSGFPARALEGSVRGLLSTFRGVNPSGDILLRLGSRRTSPGG